MNRCSIILLLYPTSPVLTAFIAFGYDMLFLKLLVHVIPEVVALRILRKPACIIANQLFDDIFRHHS
jgi:hypothetical protein